jgi:ketosteroid isomerase-like protein
VAPADNVKADIVRKAFEGFQRLDMDAFTAAWHPDIVWDVTHYEDWPDPKTEYRGEPEVIAGFAGYLGSVRSLEVSKLDVTPLEDGRVLAIHHERRYNKDSDEPTDLDIGTIYEFGGATATATGPDDQITRVDVYTGHRNARVAAGLEN